MIHECAVNHISKISSAVLGLERRFKAATTQSGIWWHRRATAIDDVYPWGNRRPT